MIVDSHCHLEYEPLFDDLENVIERATKNNIKFLLTISTTDKSFDKILKIITKYKNIYGTYGIHPHESKNNKNLNCVKILNKIKLNKKIIGIGETGLDFYYNHSNKDTQITSFKEHIKASQESNLPIIVHTRDAEKETFSILNEEYKKNLKF